MGKYAYVMLCFLYHYYYYHHYYYHYYEYYYCCYLEWPRVSSGMDHPS